MNQLFIGREKEQQQLKEYLNSEQSEFIAIYGRRRVGKTFLIQKVIGSDYAFYVAGMNKVSMRIQLKNFMQGIQKSSRKYPLQRRGWMLSWLWRIIWKLFRKAEKLSLLTKCPGWIRPVPILSAVWSISGIPGHRGVTISN